MDTIIERILDFHVCRTCLTENNCRDLYESNIVNMINECNFITVSKGDEYPRKICNQCQDLVILTYNFKQQCLKSEGIFKEYLKQYKQKSIPSNLNITNEETGDLCIAAKSILDTQLTSQEHLEFIQDTSKFKSVEALDTCVESDLSLSQTDGVIRDLHKEKLLLINNKNEIETEEHLTAFLEENVPSTLPFQCPNCIQSFSIEYDLQLHLSTHSTNEDFHCLKCGKRFATRQMLKRHIKIHMLHKPHVCKQCGKGFAESYALTKHMRSHTGLPREKKHSCRICGQRFSEPFYLNVHLRKHTGERPLMCSSCGKSFADPRSLKAHNMTHTGEKPYICNLCNKAFAQSVNLTKHIRIHTGEKPYVCTKCGKCFTQSSSLDKHTRTHTGERPYSCEQCPKRFAEKGTLLHHQRTHNGEKPYICEVCGKSYASNFELRLHDQQYKQQPCLYTVRSKEYRNKHARIRALENIQRALYLLKPDVTVADIKAKFQGLKTNFLTEYRKHEKSLKSGAGEDDVYHPTLWYYNDMFFILEHCIPRRSTDSLSFNEPPRSGSSQSESYTSNVDDIEYESQDDIIQENSEGDYEIQRDRTLTQRRDSLPPCTVTLSDNAEGSSSSSRKKIKNDSSTKSIQEAASAIKMISTAIQARNKEKPIIAQTTQPADIFSAFVASKLKQMNPQVANEVEEKITLLLFEGIKKTNNKE
ncbi:Zinc finger, C2H2 type [Popillia japonica]|uniref:Zinc finger, C2H2 type n=1 Tax=Popillia japonica TaxID=7064 RepID=A0AAW1LTK2_POPJA